MNTFKIHIAEDDPWYGEMLKYHLSLNPEYEVELFETGKSFIEGLRKKPDAVSIDFNLPDYQGEKLLKEIKSQNPTLPVIVISGQEEIEVAVNLLRHGAHDYLIKNGHTKELLWNSLLKIRETNSLKKEVVTLQEELGRKYDFEKTIIGQSPEIKKIFGFIEKAIHSTINVSISGNTGTGKEVVAKAIHYNGTRKKKPFVAVNMAAIPKDLIESELFGHEKGAFTGAVSRKIGKFEAADGGTLFLDEIAELDLNLQSKILRALQEREIVTVGGSKPIPFDARLIVATHKNLSEEVKKGNFREDLYYRIIGLPIELPPLHKRGNDILILSKHFIDEYAKQNNQKACQLTEEVKHKLMSYHFPGNVRELKSVIDLACVMCEGFSITENDIIFNAIREDNLLNGEEKTLKDHQIDIIKHYLNKYKNVVEVAKRLDVGKSTIYKLIKSGEIKI